MISTIERHSYHKQQQQFRAACDWLKGLGVRLDATRVSKYSRDLAEIDDFYSSSKIDELIKQRSFPTLINSLVEASEFIDIHEALKNVHTPALVSRLRKAVQCIFAKFHAKYRCIWENCGDDRTLAVMLHLRAPCLLENPSLLVVYTQSAFACVCPPGSANRKILDSFAEPVDAFAKSHRPDLEAVT